MASFAQPVTGSQAVTHCARCSAAVVVAVAAVFFSACGGKSPRDDIITVRQDLGIVPPGYAARLNVKLSLPDTASRFLWVASSCGCIHATLHGGSKIVRKGGPVDPREPHELRLRFEVNGTTHGRGKESIRLGFATREKAEEQAVVEFTFKVDEERSVLAERSSLSITGVAPVNERVVLLALTRALVPGSVQVEAAPWLRRADEGSGTVQALRLVVGPLMADGNYEAGVTFKTGEDEWERARIKVRVDPPGGYSLRPGAVVVSVAKGGFMALPVVLSAPTPTPTGVRVSWENGECLVDESGAAAEGLGPTLQLGPATDRHGGSGPLHLLFRVSNCKSTGVFKGRALIQPSARGFQVALPYTVRVF